MTISAKINNVPNVAGSISQGNQQIQVTKVSIPAATKVSQLTDIDLTNVSDGSFLKYNSERNIFEPTQAISGGAF